MIPPEVLLVLRIVLAIRDFFVIPDEFKNCSFQIYEEFIWNLDGDCIDYVDCLQQDGHFYYVDPANP